MRKTIRFADLVRSSGRPEIVTLWVGPKKDRSFSRALRENRVLTIHDHPKGHRKEFGQIGFHQESGATYLVFPKPLPDAPESRIVGINYQLAEDRPLEGPLARKSRRRRSSKQNVNKAAALPKPELKRFDVLVRRTATLEDILPVKAATVEAAREAALKTIKLKRFKLSRAIMREEILNVATRK